MDTDAVLAAGLVPLEGGWSGETFLAEVAGARSVVRVYAARGRGPEAPEVDAAVLRLVRGLLPVAEVLEVRRAAGEMPGLLVTTWLPGERGDLLLPRLDPAQLAALGSRVGRLAADLAGMPQLRHGEFADSDLAVRPVDLDLPAYADRCLSSFAHWAADERRGLTEVVEDAQERLDGVGRACLVHSDLNPKNLLVDPLSLTVTGVVDWEYAHAGHPATDLGNLVRLDRHAAWVEAVVGAYVDRHGGGPERVLDLARCADLWALVELATRRAANPVAARAEALLRAIARTRDVHAAPPR